MGGWVHACVCISLDRSVGGWVGACMLSLKDIREVCVL